LCCSPDSKLTNLVCYAQEKPRPVLPKDFFEQKDPTSMANNPDDKEASNEPITPGVKNLREMFEKSTK
jgi:hypothetical protein